MNEEDADAIRALYEAPVYCLDPDVLDLMATRGSYNSVVALFRSGLGTRLPYPEMIVEINDTQSTTYIILAEAKTRLVAPHPETGTDVAIDSDFVARIITVLGIGNVLDVTVCAGTFIVEAGKPDRPTMLIGLRDDRHKLKPDDVGGFHRRMAIVKLAIKALLLAMVTDGIGQRIVEAPAALNKARAGKGKPPIPRHIVISVSHYTDRAGKRHCVSSGRHVRLHWRAGHIRRQPCGPGRRQRKAIFIAPVLINYAPGITGLPSPATHILRP